METNLLSILEAQKIIGLGKTKLYELINTGEIPAKKLGNRTLIAKNDLKDFIDQLESYPVKSKGGTSNV